MKPKKPPKLYAIYGPDGERKTMPCDSKGAAGCGVNHSWGRSFDANARRLKRQGYTCEEVEIVRVKR